MAGYRKRDGSVTVTGDGGRVETNVSGVGVAGPGASVTVPAAPSSPSGGSVPSLGPMRAFARDVDTHLAELYYARTRINRDLDVAFDRLHYALGDERDRSNGSGWVLSNQEVFSQAMRGGAANPPGAAEALAQVRAQQDLLVDNLRQSEDLEDEFEAAGGWSRAFVVPDGHVHKSMRCATCRWPTTEFEWLPEYSGADETEIVDAAGERACTICYPTAPVDVLSRASRIQASSEKNKAAAKSEREAKKAKAAEVKASKAPCADGSELTVVTERGYHTSHHPVLGGDPYERTETFKTERAATLWAVDQLAWDIGLKEWKGPDSGISDTEHAAVATIISVLADKRGIDPAALREEFEAKAAAKHKRDSR